MRRASAAWLLSAAVSCGLSCSSPVETDRGITVRSPISVAPAGTPPILYEKTVVRLPAGTVYGAVYDLRRSNAPPQELVHTSKHTETEEFNILITDRMSALGYDVIDPTDAIFTPDNTVKTRFRVVGVITALNIETHRHFSRPNRSYQTAELDLEVRLYDAQRKEVVYAESFHGEARDGGSSPVALPEAVLMAVEGALADPRFVGEITSEASGKAVAPDVLRLPACPATGKRLPGDIEEVAGAVVTVRQGGSLGSGVLISSAGHVLTAAHLLSRRHPPRVGVRGGIELEASVERMDPLMDVALLKIPGTGHRCLPLHHGQPVRVGTNLFAIGVPLDDRLAGSVTRGIVSGRPTVDGQVLLQTDASINPGSSGGPVLSEDGLVLGLVSSKYFGLGVEGVGFAVPADVIRKALRVETD